MSGPSPMSSRLTEIPSPPFGEEKRAGAYLENAARPWVGGSGRQDEIGNVMGIPAGYGNGEMRGSPRISTRCSRPGRMCAVRREGTKLFARVSDDTWFARGQPRLSGGR